MAISDVIAHMKQASNVARPFLLNRYIIFPNNLNSKSQRFSKILFQNELMLFNLLQTNTANGVHVGLRHVK